MSRIYLSAPHIGPEEEQLVLEALRSGWIAPLGPQVDAFEQEISAVVGRKEAVALSSGTAALHLALLLLGVGPGDEVVTSSLTFAATANAIAYTGASPVFIDSEPRTWNMDPELLAEELDARARDGRSPKAVLVVDLYGQCADYGSIAEICARHDVPLVEDSAEALGASYRGKPAGSFGTMAALSFNGNKMITTSGGGMLLTDVPEQAKRARFLATQARDPAAHYEHSVIGYNYRLSGILAALGRAQLRGLQARVERRRAINRLYREGLGDLGGVDFMPEASEGRSNCWLTVITVDPDRFGATREELRMHLEGVDIEARPAWKPMHLQPVFASRRMRGGSTAEAIFANGLCLPSGSGLDDAAIGRVIDTIRSFSRR